MGSTSNPNPWAPYDSYSDCSQGICNVYCPQWCYLIFPPPPPSFLDEESSSSSSFSPLLIALIGILASAFLLVSYYTLISKYCHRRRQNSSEALGYVFSSAPESRRGISNSAGDGLNDSLIKSITVYKYRRGDGFVDCSDCSVCLSEFEDNESLRLLPKCNHAFHLPCIDTWLKSHSNCPLCRAFVTGIDSTAKTVAVSNQPNQIDIESLNQGGQTIEMNSTMVGDHEHRTSDSVVVIRELEIGSRNINIRTEEQRDAKDENPQPIRRSVSLNSGIAVSITDVLRDIKDYERDEEGSAGVGTSQQRREVEDAKTLTSTASQRSGVSSFMVRSSVAMKRSASTGRFIFSRPSPSQVWRVS